LRSHCRACLYTAAAPPDDADAAAAAERRWPQRRRPRIVLGIESSCDETAVAIVSEDRRILAEVVSSQWDVHAELGGVMPHLAAREHERNLPSVLRRALEMSELPNGLADVDAIAVSVGPGLAPCLKVGLAGAKAIVRTGRLPRGGEDEGEGAEGAKVGGAVDSSGGGGGGGVAGSGDGAALPLVPVHHLEAHALVTRLFDPGVAYPFLTLLVSGGHCMLVLAEGLGEYRALGTTLDDSVGEAYDKVARMLRVESGAGHGGAALERLAKRGRVRCDGGGGGGGGAGAGVGEGEGFRFATPMARRNDCHFSFSGLKTAVLYTVNALLLQQEEGGAAGAGGGGGKARARAGVATAAAATIAQRAPEGTLSAASLGEQRREGRRRAAVGSAPGMGEDEEGGEAGDDAAPRLTEQQQADLAAAFQHAAVAHLSQRTARALRWCAVHAPGVGELVVCGGVAANEAVREALRGTAAAAGVRPVFPPQRYCTDNGVMVAWAGVERLQRGDAEDVLVTEAGVAALDFRPRWPLGPLVEGREAEFSRRAAASPRRFPWSGRPVRVDGFTAVNL
jgi:tRNA A37 threonylcarbamoyltransferase TsaD